MLLTGGVDGFYWRCPACELISEKLTAALDWAEKEPSAE